MRASTLRHHVTVQERAQGQDALGQPLLDWHDIATIRAGIEPLSGRELMVAQANQSELTHTVTIRYQAQFADPKVMATRRLLYGARVLNIHASIDVEERHFDLQLSCAEGLNDG